MPGATKNAPTTGKTARTIPTTQTADPAAPANPDATQELEPEIHIPTSPEAAIGFLISQNLLTKKDVEAIVPGTICAMLKTVATHKQLPPIFAAIISAIALVTPSALDISNIIFSRVCEIDKKIDSIDTNAQKFIELAENPMPLEEDLGGKVDQLISAVSKSAASAEAAEKAAEDSHKSLTAFVDAQSALAAKDLAQLHSLQETLKKTESQLSEHSHAYRQTKRQLATSQEESAGLRQQLQWIRSECWSLRSQLHLQDNTEQSSIVQTLKDLNREVDDVGRLISEYLFDNYVQKVFGKGPSVVTALGAHHLPELKALLGHVDGRPSLVAASNDVGMPAEDFLDYATRTLLCKHLCGRVFSPFHPAADPSKNGVVAAIYDDVQRREPQAVAAKWRANCFKSIFKPEGPDAVAQHVNVVVQEFVESNLTPLLTYFFGQAPGVRLEHQHLVRLIQLFRMAWDWNSMLRGEVIMLGDFYLTYYAPMHRFDPSLMGEFEPDSRKSQPKYILGTLGLGLLSSRAVGGGKAPEVTVVSKATVAGMSLYR
ncbi:hypothetical protein FRC10_011378 [Ceratobasidium sp. 414]|nr:hypothetical protein FRC10_011378 [Ceratobasidium sp. 414]